MNQQAYLLGVELQTLGIRETDLNLAPTILIFLDEEGNYHFATGIEEIKTVIIGIIPHLGSRYCQGRIFNIQILPGNKIDAYLASIHHAYKFRSPRLRKTNPKYQKK